LRGKNQCKQRDSGGLRSVATVWYEVPAQPPKSAEK
jgi:hypothetical protein